MIGQTIAAHYRIVGQLGAGGMGVVYSAEDTLLGRSVAIKFVSSELPSDHHAIERLRIEARAASALNHSNICTIYDFGEHEGRPFIAMELMKGRTLRERLESGPLKITQVVDFGIQIAAALAAAHAEGIIHRDIKPANIFLTDRGVVKILDFGLAKLLPARQGPAAATARTTEGSDQLTARGVAVGTVAYMSPEQANGDDLDGRTDLFSLGVVLYQCATGQAPFAGKTPAAVLMAVVGRAPVPPTIVNPEIPIRLQDVINNCLEKDPELRYQAAADLGADLKRVKRDLESVAQSLIDGPVRNRERSDDTILTGRAPVVKPTSEDPVARPGWRSNRFLIPAAIGAISVVAVLAVISFGLWPGSNSTTLQPTTPGAQQEARPGSLSESQAQAQVDLATASLRNKDIRAALASAEAVLREVPGHAAAIDVRDNARAQIERLDKALADARRSLAARNADGATRALNEARAIAPATSEIAELSAELVNQLKGQAADLARQNAARPAAAPVQPPPARPEIRVDPPASSLPSPSGSAASAASTVARSDPPQLPAPPAAAQPGAGPPSALPEPPAARPDPATARPPTPPSGEPSAQPSGAAARSSQPAGPVGGVGGRRGAGADSSTTTAPAAPTAAEDEAAIRELLVTTYARAIETKSIPLFRKAKPNLSAEEERRLIEAFRGPAQRIEITILSIDRRGDRASVRVRRRDTIGTAGRQQTSESQHAMTLVRASGGWVIEAIGQ